MTDPFGTAAEAGDALDAFLGTGLNRRELPTFEVYFEILLRPGGVLENNIEDRQTLNLYDTVRANWLHGSALGRMRIDEIGTVHLQRHVNAMYKSLAERTVSRYVSIFRAVLTEAVTEKMLHARIEHGVVIPANPADGLKLRKLPDARSVILEEEELVNFPAAAKLYTPFSNRLSEMLIVMIDTGVRPGELCAMKAEKIRNGVWLVDDTRRRDGTLKGETKTGKDRAIALSEDALAAIAAQGIARGPVWINQYGTHKGKPVRPITFTRQIARFREWLQKRWNAEHVAAGGDPENAPRVPAFTPRDLRKTFATRAVEVDIKAAQAILGHASAKTTLDIYAKSRKRRHAPLIDALSKGKRGSEGAENAPIQTIGEEKGEHAA